MSAYSRHIRVSQYPLLGRSAVNQYRWVGSSQESCLSLTWTTTPNTKGSATQFVSLSAKSSSHYQSQILTLRLPESRQFQDPPPDPINTRETSPLPGASPVDKKSCSSVDPGYTVRNGATVKAELREKIKDHAWYSIRTVATQLLLDDSS